MLSHNAERVVELVKMRQSVSSMISQLEHYQENSSQYMAAMATAGNGLDSLLTSIDDELNRLI